MTVTSIPASTPTAPAKPEGSNASDHKSGAADDGFASALAGAHDEARGKRSEGGATAKGAGNRSTHGAKATRDAKAARRAGPEKDKAAADAAEAGETTNDPVTSALLTALVAAPPTAPRSDPDATPPTAAPPTATPPTADPAAISAVADAAAGLAPATALPTADPAATASAAEVAANAAATAAPVLDENVTAAKATPATDPDATDPDAPAESAPTRTEPGAKAAATAPAPASSPGTPPTSATSALDAAATAAVAAAANPTPEVRPEPAPKSDTIADNAMITAATVAADRAPTPERTAAVAAPAAPAAPADPPPSAQLAAVIRPLQRGADGTYQIRVEMRPPELGRVDMRVEIRDGVIHASIHAERTDTADLMRAALDELRARLDADGMQSGRFTVDSQGANTPGRDNNPPTPDRLDDAPLAAIPEPVAVALTTTSDSLLDVRI